MSALRLILLGLVTFVVAAVLTAPAAQWLGRLPPGAVQLLGIEGSLREGRVAGLVNRGKPALEDLRWTLRASPLLKLRLGADVSARLPSREAPSPFTARVSLGLGGRLHVEQLRGAVSLPVLAALAGQSYLPLEGMADLDLDELVLKDGQAPRAQGVLRLRALRWTLAAAPLALGDVEAAIAPKGDDLEVKFSSASGPIELGGDAQLRADRSYELHLQMRPGSGADPALVNLLRTLGPPDNAAWYHLRRNGSL